MTRIRATSARTGFTLVELLVAMSVIVVLATVAVIVVPGALNQDRTTDGAGSVRQMLMIAKARAGRDGLPRGVRLITGTDPNNPAKTNPAWVTEVQYIEAPPVFIPNPGANGTTTSPRVVFNYTTDSGNSITTRQCQIQNLSSTNGIESGAVLSLPTLGIWLTLPTDVTTSGSTVAFNLMLPPAPPATLDPKFADATELDARLGAASNLNATTSAYVTYHFGVYGRSRPLLGEPTAQLPKNICIDLPSSLPSGNATDTYDIMFAPNGHVTSPAAGQINLWVRDYTKNGGSSGNFQQGGEQQVVSIKAKSGGLGVYPIAWPPASPFDFARQ